METNYKIEVVVVLLLFTVNTIIINTWLLSTWTFPPNPRYLRNLILNVCRLTDEYAPRKLPAGLKVRQSIDEARVGFIKKPYLSTIRF